VEPVEAEVQVEVKVKVEGYGTDYSASSILPVALVPGAVRRQT
jgi:hypothetical protein